MSPACRAAFLLVTFATLAAASVAQTPPATAPAAPAASQAPASPSPSAQLAPLAHWVGGEWRGSIDAPGGRRVTLVRTYEWSFDRRLLIGRSFGEVEGRRRQSRETVYFWNPETRRIEFHDFLDQAGGYGAGTLEVRDGVIHMDVKIVGNPGHPPWRAQIREQGDEQTIQVEALKDGQWAPFGTFPYKRQR